MSRKNQLEVKILAQWHLGKQVPKNVTLLYQNTTNMSKEFDMVQKDDRNPMEALRRESKQI